ncbi:MAG: Alkaline phosphatase D-related protein [Frankiales bacterium]|nr:Alkaline phosphatase D-related protein [Frankiales bacterium]
MSAAASSSSARNATNGSPTTAESTNLFDPSLIGTTDFSDVFALSNLPNLTGPDSSHLLIISQESGKIVNVDRSGQVESSLTISDPTSPISVPDETQEGVTMDRDGYLYTVNADRVGLRDVISAALGE